MNRKQGTLALGISAVLASNLIAGCSSSSHKQINDVGVCMDTKTHKRLPDADCNHSNHGASYVYYGMGRRVPAVGQVGSGYTTTEPKDYYTKGGFSTKGGASSDYMSLVSGNQQVYGGSAIRAKGGTDAHGVAKGGSIARGGFGGHGGGEGHGG